MKTFKQMIEAADKDEKGDGAEYKAFFAKALKKFGASSIADLKGDDKKKFYDYVDANWEADDEKAESVQEATHAKWIITVKQKFNGLKMKASVEVVARGTTEALKKGAKKLGVPEAWKHAGVLDVKKVK
jgi:hypothetical protein